MDRSAEARWTGDLKTGQGNIKLGSRAFESPYSFTSRFENGQGTNPEELLGAAHAGCFSMALSLALSLVGHPPTSVTTTATVHLAKVGAGFAIAGINLRTRGVVPGVSASEFQRLAEDTKVNCIISKALAAVPMQLDAQLT
ncbi:MAG: OsmC family protein [Gemmatimonadales bacterium]